MAKTSEIPAVEPAEYEEGDVGAMQALQRGDASDIQQQRAFTWILEKACGLKDWAYRPGANDRDTNVALGRQFVGQQMIKLCKINLKSMRRKT